MRSSRTLPTGSSVLILHPPANNGILGVGPDLQISGVGPTRDGDPLLADVLATQPIVGEVIWDRGQEVVARHAVGIGLRKSSFLLAMAFPIKDGRVIPTFMVGMNY